MKIVIGPDDTPEDIERKMAEAFAPIREMRHAVERAFTHEPDPGDPS